ncbi:hypothetical protein [Actinosynnema sp. NPDC020468]|uniref:hypothetical protein n=1 Tax=Actinosynnema sp. NPDC020468 TaxID=3154488 RepID=UPI0033ECFA87
MFGILLGAVLVAALTGVPAGIGAWLGADRLGRPGLSAVVGGLTFLAVFTTSFIKALSSFQKLIS